MIYSLVFSVLGILAAFTWIDTSNVYGTLSYHSCGVGVCLSPWHFDPLGPLYCPWDGTILHSSKGLRAIPVRTNITYFNTKYLGDSTFTITRFGRKSPYYFNIHANILHEWNNNVTVQLVFNEFLHNEYKRSFIEFKEKFCDFLSSNVYIGTAIKHAGMSCPLKANRYSLENITFPTENFPNVFPFKKGRVDVLVTRTGDKTLIESGFVELNFDLDKNKSAH